MSTGVTLLGGSALLKSRAVRGTKEDKAVCTKEAIWGSGRASN